VDLAIEAKTDVPKLWVSDEQCIGLKIYWRTKGYIPYQVHLIPGVTLNPFSRWPYKEWDVKKVGPDYRLVVERI